jgi:hypothetical protein
VTNAKTFLNRERHVITDARRRSDLTARLLSSFAATFCASDRSGQTEVAFMASNEPTYFDLETVSVLKETLEDAWGCLRPEQRINMSRSLLAERILKAAAAGERDRERLRDAALDVAA